MTGAEIPLAQIIIGALAGGAVSAGSSALSKSDDPKMPEDIAIPAQPDLPKAPTAEEADYLGQKARDKEKRRAGSRSGRSSTILTGSLGTTTPANTSQKSLLGQ